MIESLALLALVAVIFVGSMQPRDRKLVDFTATWRRVRSSR